MLEKYNQREPQYPSYVDTNHFGFCLRAAHDLPKGTIVATGSLVKTEKPYIAGHELEEHKYVAVMDGIKMAIPLGAL